MELTPSTLDRQVAEHQDKNSSPQDLLTLSKTGRKMNVVPSETIALTPIELMLACMSNSAVLNCCVGTHVRDPSTEERLRQVLRCTDLSLPGTN